MIHRSWGHYRSACQLHMRLTLIEHDRPTGRDFVCTLTEFDHHSVSKCLPPRRPRQWSPASGIHPDRPNRSAADRFGPSKGEYYCDHMKPSYNKICSIIVPKAIYKPQTEKTLKKGPGTWTSRESSGTLCHQSRQPSWCWCPRLCAPWPRRSRHRLCWHSECSIRQPSIKKKKKGLRLNLA